MATVIPVDEFISDEWYPGFNPDYGHAPWCVDPVRTFRKEDEKASGGGTHVQRCQRPSAGWAAPGTGADSTARIIRGKATGS